MQNKVPAPGDPIVARCTKCRENTNHIIVAVLEEAPVKVQCNICERQHKFRAPSQAKKRTPRKASTNAATTRKNWEELRDAVDRGVAKKYAMSETFHPDELVDHPTFGIGIVQRVTGSQKVEILFESGPKLMRCK